MVKKLNIHGTAIIMDGVGVLLRGPSGAGKSLLALELIALSNNSDRQITLIADDRIDITIDITIDIIKENKQIIMQPPSSIAGLIELYGHGIISMQYISNVKLGLVVDFTEFNKRMPERSDFYTMFEGIKLMRCPIPMRNQTSSSHQILLIEAALAKLQKNK